MSNITSKINQCILPSGKFSHNKAKSLFDAQDMIKLKKMTNFLSDDSSFSKRCICVLKNITRLPKCKICGSPHENYSCGSFSLTCGNKLCHTKLRIQKAAATMRNNGTYVQNANQHKIRMSNPIMKEKHSNAISKALNTPDKEGILPKVRAATGLRTTLKNNPKIFEERKDKQRKSMEAAGYWIPKDQIDAATRYRLAVFSETMKQPLHMLENFDKRGPSTSFQSNNFHIDHIFSVSAGFKHNVPPEIIGHISNLRMLHHRENVRKSGKSDISLEELYSKFYSYK